MATRTQQRCFKKTCLGDAFLSSSTVFTVAISAWISGVNVMTIILGKKWAFFFKPNFCGK
jgi:hypothetical protein